MEELKRYWKVDVTDLPAGDYGWGFVKLEPLFGPLGKRFLVLDSDTVITGPVLELAAQHDEDFIVDDESQSPEGAKEIYYDSEKAAEEGSPVPYPAFLFNTGQWFGRSGMLSRGDFGGLVQWGFPSRLTNPRVFKNGEQGVLNFVANEHVRSGKIRVARIRLMRWPGHGMQGLDVQSISKRSAAPLVVHWAGMKKPCQRNMIGGDLLAYFEKVYYQRLPAGETRRVISGYRHAFSHWLLGAHVRAKLASRRLAKVRRTSARGQESNPAEK